MTLTEINTQFQAVTDAIAELNGYSFGWASDRTRSQTYDEPGEDQQHARRAVQEPRYQCDD